MNESLKPANAITLDQVPGKVTEIIQKITSYDVFSKLETDIGKMAKAYQIDSAFDTAEGLPPKVQQDYTISEIPPEGIVIRRPGYYTLSATKGNTVSWKPTQSIGAAITVESDNVILDLGGCSLDATIQDSSSNLIGIFVHQASNVEIINGSLTNHCLAGIHATHVLNLQIKNVLVSGIQYQNTNKRGASPSGISVTNAVGVSLISCEVAYMYVSSDTCAAIQLSNTIGGNVDQCRVNNVVNYAGAVLGISNILSCSINTTACVADKLQSHFGGNIRTGGHTVLGFFPLFCVELLYQDCIATNITGSCDDCHGMSIFFDAEVEVKNYRANNVTDGVTQFHSGAKATGLEVYGADIKISDSTVKNIVAINPQDRLSTGFSSWGENIVLENCVAESVFVENDINNEQIIMGLGTGFGWAPDPRLYHTAATNVTYKDCSANKCQVAFDTWNHINGKWINPSYSNCAINILVEPGASRTIKNQASGNIFPGSSNSI